MSVFYVYIFKKIKSFKVEIPFLLILLFLIFSKVLTPQYLFWSVLLLPLFARSKLVLFTTALILLLTQYIYPLHYNDLIWKFYVDGSQSLVFYILVLRNFLMVLLFILIFRSLNSGIIKKHITNEIA